MKKFLLLMLLAATPAFAHAHLKSSVPAANARVKSPGQIKLVFSETLEPAFSGADLSDAAGKTVPVSRAVGGDSISLMPLTLKPGAYKVSWHSVGQDTHRLSGSFAFTVIP
jgi:methionine-rich copper-binding protein CopC